MISFIPGLSVGFEWAYDDGFIILDLGIIRFTWDYWGLKVRGIQQQLEENEDGHQG